MKISENKRAGHSSPVQSNLFDPIQSSPVQSQSNSNFKTQILFDTQNPNQIPDSNQFQSQSNLKQISILFPVPISMQCKTDPNTIQFKPIMLLPLAFLPSWLFGVAVEKSSLEMLFRSRSFSSAPLSYLEAWEAS